MNKRNIEVQQNQLTTYIESVCIFVKITDNLKTCSEHYFNRIVI